MTFLLSDIDEAYKSGPLDPREWVTYFHIYDNNVQGKTIQYWVFYSFNSGGNILGIQAGFHGGDWEMVAVILNKNLDPVEVRFTGHSSLDANRWADIQTQGTHPVVYAERGGHEMHASPLRGTKDYIQHPTWPGSSIRFSGSLTLPVGPLVNMGTKLRPKADWVTYSGLWGSIGFLPYSSGYWGPAFNETGMPASGFLRAWCDGTSAPDASLGGKRECYADDPEE